MSVVVLSLIVDHRFELLAKHNLTFDCQVNPHQLLQAFSFFSDHSDVPVRAHACARCDRTCPTPPPPLKSSLRASLPPTGCTQSHGLSEVDRCR